MTRIAVVFSNTGSTVHGIASIVGNALGPLRCRPLHLCLPRHRLQPGGTAGATDSQQYTLHMLVPPWTLLSSLYNEKMHFLRCCYMYTVSFRPIEVNIQDADAFHLVSLRRPSAFLIPVSVHPS